MPEQLKDLLNKIHKEGIKAAEEKTRQIENEAQLKAQKIVNDAKKQAQVILEDAKLDAEKMKESAEASIKQAARNLMISVKNEILALSWDFIEYENPFEVIKGLIKMGIDGILFDNHKNITFTKHWLTKIN